MYIQKYNLFWIDKSCYHFNVEYLEGDKGVIDVFSLESGMKSKMKFNLKLNSFSISEDYRYTINKKCKLLDIEYKRIPCAVMGSVVVATVRLLVY